MIIFTPILNIPNELLMAKGITSVIKFNLSTYYVDVPTLFNLVPTFTNKQDKSLNDYDNPSFDIAYHRYLLDNNVTFNEFMSIVIPANMNPDCLIQVLIKQSEFRDVVTESLLKLIQQRYGYNCYIVNEVEDFIYTDESDFSIPGLFAFEQDRARWFALNNVGEEYRNE